VRVARPELEVSTAALLERIERLERSGVASSPPSQPQQPAPRSRPSLGELRPTAQRARAAAPAPAPAAPAEGAADEPETPKPVASPEAGGPDRDALTLAWGDTILDALSPRARALFRSGRFVEADGTSCTFAIESDAQREQCERKRTEVEAALASHFGSPVAVRLVVDAGPAARTPSATTAEPQAAPSRAGDDLLAVDLDELDGGIVADSESIAAARVLDAFPGATEVRS
jgi:hypothetical protein